MTQHFPPCSYLWHSIQKKQVLIKLICHNFLKYFIINIGIRRFQLLSCHVQTVQVFPLQREPELHLEHSQHSRLTAVDIYARIPTRFVFILHLRVIQFSFLKCTHSYIFQDVSPTKNVYGLIKHLAGTFRLEIRWRSFTRGGYPW